MTALDGAGVERAGVLDPALVDARASFVGLFPVVHGPADVPASRAAGASRVADVDEVADAFDVSIDEVTLGGMPALRCTPRVPVRSRAVFLHGGGLIAGSPVDGLRAVLEHASPLGLEVWSLDYPLAPEHSLDEACAAVRGAIDALPADGRPTLLAGQSAGGGLAASVALDDASGIAGIMLLCPMVDVGTGSASEREFADDPMWNRTSNESAWSMALAGTRRLPPGRREIGALPPVFIDTGTCELFRDDIVAFAGRLVSAGVAAQLVVAEGGFHSSDCVVPDAPSSIVLRRARAAWLGELLDASALP